MRFHLQTLLLFLAVLFPAQAQTENPHAKIIRALDTNSFARGKTLYEAICITCHGTPDREGTLPTSRPFWKEPFKNGGDPYSLFKTLTHGLGQMPALAVLSAQERYDVAHYLRETFVRPLNPSAYVEVTERYLASLPKDFEPLAISAEARAAKKEPPYLKMDFGPVMFWTFQVATNNIAYKGIAIRVDEGPGGVSKGGAWMLYDHDTMRLAAAWKGDKFIDWRGIAFDGSHNSHSSIVGKNLISPPGPGWAHPETGSLEDPRFRGRDGKPYGPLPREWAHYQGLYVQSNRVALKYTVGDATILETPGYENGVFTRTLQTSKSSRPLKLRNGSELIEIPRDSTVKISLGHGTVTRVSTGLSHLTNGGPSRWNQPLMVKGRLGTEEGPFAVDEVVPPPDLANPWHTWMRFGGFDFFKDGKRAAISTWNGDVWLVSGIDGDLSQVTWRRIATGLFQPLGVRIVDEKIYVACRDQIARLHDLNGDEEIDFIENFNNDHQVTEHFHEFAMGLQTDREGNFYYAKSARHALKALVPHHGTLLKVTADGARTEIVANGFRAANGVCVNEDGTFFVTDQEGHWTPKNRINHVHKGGFYGNMFGYTDRTNTADTAMEQPLVWITNEMDRSPGELVRITSEGWGPLKGGLLNLSYGTGRVFLVPHEDYEERLQGGVVQLPIPEFPTGVMRGRFHPQNGHLYACGMYAWAGNKQADGGFYRVRATGKPSYLPTAIRARAKTLQIHLSDPVDPEFAQRVENYSIKAWDLKRSANYGSKHINEHALEVTFASLAPDGKTLRLTVPDLAPTRSMEIKLTLRADTNPVPFTRIIHNTIHSL